LAIAGPMPFIIPEPRYFSMLSTEARGKIFKSETFICFPYFGVITYSPKTSTCSPILTFKKLPNMVSVAFKSSSPNLQTLKSLFSLL